MKQRIENPKTLNELSGMKDETLFKYAFKNGLLFVNNLGAKELNRADFIKSLHDSQFDKIKVDFYEIMDNPQYFEREGDTRYYLTCFECGFVTKDHIDHESEYLDLHCKCGSAMYYCDYTDYDIDQMRANMIESRIYGDYFMKDFYEETETEIIEKYVRGFKKIWYYGW